MREYKTVPWDTLGTLGVRLSGGVVRRLAALTELANNKGWVWR